MECLDEEDEEEEELAIVGCVSLSLVYFSSLVWSGSNRLFSSLD